MKKEIGIKLRQTNPKDLETLFEFQLDKEANYLAAFTSENPTDKEAYFEKWTKLLLNEKINAKTIFLGIEIVGIIAKFEMNGNAEVTYWIGKKFWGRGIATTALKKFLEIEKARPIYGRIAFNNFGSKRVLEHCGFSKIGTEKGFANARSKVIEEFIFELK